MISVWTDDMDLAEVRETLIWNLLKSQRDLASWNPTIRKTKIKIQDWKVDQIKIWVEKTLIRASIPIGVEATATIKIIRESVYQ